MIDERSSGLWDARVRPASLQYATDAYPAVVDGLIHRAYVVQPGPANVERRLVALTGGSGRTVMTREDYDILQSIAASLEPVPAFLSEPKEQFLQRIRAIVRVRFAGRGAY